MASSSDVIGWAAKERTGKDRKGQERKGKARQGTVYGLWEEIYTDSVQYGFGLLVMFIYSDLT